MKVKQIPIGMYENRRLVTVVCEPEINRWQIPGYRDRGWVIHEFSPSQFDLYEFEYGPELFCQSYSTLAEAVIAAETELT